MNKIALLVASCPDLPKEYQDRYQIYVMPLMIIYKEGEYYDGVNITPEEVYERFNEEIPTTSLPSPETVMNTFKQIKDDGYTHVIAVTISSGLSNTWSMVSSVAREFEGLTITVIDTKNIGIGAGFSAILAGQLLDQGLSYEEVCRRLMENVEHTKLFFCVSTLEYLQKGGRIGLVASLLGTAFDLKPIISCNEDGIYYTVTKVRGRNKSLKKATELAEAFAKKYKRYNLTVMHGGAKEEADKIVLQLKAVLPNIQIMVEGQITPALVVHTGPGLIGIGVQKIEE